MRSHSPSLTIIIAAAAILGSAGRGAAQEARPGQAAAPLPPPTPSAVPAPIVGAPPMVVPAPAPATTIVVPGAAKPSGRSFSSPAGPPAFRPSLPAETPPEQAVIDPTQPIVDFVTAIERAYWTNPQLIAERARARSFDFRLPQARGQYGPQLQYSGSLNYLQSRTDRPIGTPFTQSGWTSTATAVLRQPIFTFGRLRAGEDAARATIAFGQASLRVTEQDILFNAINIYSAVLRDRLGVGIAADNAALLERQSADTETRLGARESTITDAQQAASRLELARAQLLAAQNAVAASEALFLRFVGGPPGALTAPNPLQIPVRTLEEAYAFSDAHNPLLAGAYARERLSRAELAAARAELLPRIDLAGQASYGTVSPFSNEQRQTQLGAGITISGTLDVGIRRSRIDEAAAANDSDWRLIDAALRENRAELANAWSEWQTQTAAIDRLAAAVQAARQALDGALLQERAGLRTTLDVLDLARDLLQVRSSFNATTTNAFVAQARVLAAMGALDVKYLLPDRKRYDPEVHLRKVDNQADIPLFTPLIRAIDSITTPSRADRPVRDPAAPVALVPAAQP